MEDWIILLIWIKERKGRLVPLLMWEDPYNTMQPGGLQKLPCPVALQADPDFQSWNIGRTLPVDINQPSNWQSEFPSLFCCKYTQCIAESQTIICMWDIRYHLQHSNHSWNPIPSAGLDLEGKWKSHFGKVGLILHVTTDAYAKKKKKEKKKNQPVMETFSDDPFLIISPKKSQLNPWV